MEKIEKFLTKLHNNTSDNTECVLQMSITALRSVQYLGSDIYDIINQSEKKKLDSDILKEIITYLKKLNVYSHDLVSDPKPNY